MSTKLMWDAQLEPRTWIRYTHTSSSCTGFPAPMVTAHIPYSANPDLPLVADDTPLRQQALNPRESFIVQAPAGSGKTALLVQRYLQLLAHVHQPEEIVAITFTQKAAREMRFRLLKALHQAAYSEPPAIPDYAHQTDQLARQALARSAQRGWSLLHNPHRLRIQTFDAFCAEWAFKAPLISQVPRHRTILPHPQSFFREQIQTFLSQAYLEPWAPAVSQFLYTLRNDHALAERLLIAMLEKREQWLPYVIPLRHAETPHAWYDTVAHAWHTWIETVLADFYQAWQVWAPHITPILETAATTCLSLRDIDLHTVSGAKQLADWLLTQAGTWRKNWTAKQGFPAPSSSRNPEEKQKWAAHKAAISEWIQHWETDPAGAIWLGWLQAIQQLPDPEMTPAEHQGLDALFQILPILVAHIEVAFENHHCIDFSGIAQAAWRALGTWEQPSALAEQLATQIRHWLIDEFQDTSVAQFQWVERCLTLSTRSATPDNPHTVFLVGDPMQSIYRFRQAEVNVFLHVQQKGYGPIRCTPLILRKNFRTRPAIVQWINQEFSRIFPAQPDSFYGAVPYQLSAPTREDADHGRVHYIPMETPDQECAQLMAIIRTEQARVPHTRIGILVRTRKQADPIIACLRQHQIAYQAIGLHTLWDRPTVQDLYGLLQALMQPADRLAWIGVWRAPWCGLVLADLDHLLRLYPHPTGPEICRCFLADHHAQLTSSTDAVPHWPSWHDPQTPIRFAATAQILLSALEAFPYRTSIRTWLYQTWEHLQGPACLTEETAEDATAFFDRLDTLCAYNPLPDWNLLRESLEHESAVPTQIQPGAVQLMTIHQSKGLEFDVVLLPFLNRPVHKTEPRLLLWKEVETGPEFQWLMAPFGKGGTSDKWTYLQQLEQASAEHEQRRLLYVAVTRTRETLYLLASPTTNRSHHFLGYFATSALSAMESPPLPDLHAPAISAAVDPNKSETSPTNQQPVYLHRLPIAAWEALPGILPSPAHPIRSQERTHLLPHQSPDSTPAPYGLCIQELLHRHVQYRLPPDQAPCRSTIARIAAQYPPLRAQLDTHVAFLEAWCHRLWAHPTTHWILQPAASTEPVCTTWIDQGQSHHVDRIFQDPTGCWWIIQYESGLWTGEPLPEHHKQLAAYQNYCRHKGYRSAQIGFYFLQNLYLLTHQG